MSIIRQSINVQKDYRVKQTQYLEKYVIGELDPFNGDLGELTNVPLWMRAILLSALYYRPVLSL